MKSNRFRVIGIALAVSGCTSPGDPSASLRDYGFVFLQSAPGGGAYTMVPTALFYRTSRPVPIPPPAAQTDRCVREPATNPPLDDEVQPTISAGPSLQLTLSGTEASLAQLLTSTRIWYGIATGGPMSFVPGDTARILIPGEAARFPEWTIEAKTAEAFVPEPVPTHDSPMPIELRWDPSDGPGSTMIVTLRYNVNNSQEQVYCELVDDGTHVLPADWVDAWRVASPFSKSAVFVRRRITSDEAEGTRLHVIATLRVPAQ